MDDWELELAQDDDYEYGYDYLYENEKRPTDAAEDADGPDEEDDDNWWEEDEETLLDEIRAGYPETESNYEAAPVEDDELPDEEETHSLSYAEILAEIRAEEKAQRETGAQKTKKRLVRDMKAEALNRMENAARTEAEFRAVQEVWDDNDKSRERYLRLHEVWDEDTVIEYNLSRHGGSVIPHWFNDPMIRQLMKGYFLDYFADCPYEMHDLLAQPYLSRIIKDMKVDHKELVYFLYLRLFSPRRVANLRGQTDRNIRKVRNTAIHKLEKKVYNALKERQKKGLSFMRQEREFLEGYEAGKEKKPE